MAITNKMHNKNKIDEINKLLDSIDCATINISSENLIKMQKIGRCIKQIII